jgi:hypothetical protein
MLLNDLDFAIAPLPRVSVFFSATRKNENGGKETRVTHDLSFDQDYAP